MAYAGHSAGAGHEAHSRSLLHQRLDRIQAGGSSGWIERADKGAKGSDDDGRLVE
jgi:hypothetical protein